jgi:hypothetical protein
LELHRLLESQFLVVLSASLTTLFSPDLDDNSCPINSYNQCDSNNNSTVSSQKQKKLLQLINNSSNSSGANSMLRNSYYSGSQTKSFSDSSSSTSSLSDLDEITIVKEEPLSPHSSCPPSPNSNYNNPLPSISSINPDLMYDRKVRSLRVDEELVEVSRIVRRLGRLSRIAKDS